MKRPTITLIVTTYNRPKALQAVLHSVREQTILPDQVIVADDGSTMETAQLIQAMSRNFPVPLIHSWQEDSGFRLSASRNRAIARATGAYIILVDGDMVLDRHYVRDIARVIKPSVMYVTSRVYLGQRATVEIERNADSFLVSSIKRSDIEKNHLNQLTIPGLWRLFPPIKDQRHTRGYVAFWRADCIAINGFDERYQGWGREDSDFVVRMCWQGVSVRRLKHCAVAYHLYHPEAARDREQLNDQLFHSVAASRTIYCLQGIDQYL